jgi:hypothetical protein
MPPKLGTERGTGNRTCSGCASDPDVVAAVLIDQPVIGIELDPGDTASIRKPVQSAEARRVGQRTWT